MKYWEIIAGQLSKAGWSWGCVALRNAAGQVLFVVGAHRADGIRSIVRSDQKLTAFFEMQTQLKNRAQELTA